MAEEKQAEIEQRDEQVNPDLQALEDITHEQVTEAVNASEMYLLEGLHSAAIGSDGKPVIYYYWQAEIDDPVDAKIQVIGEGEDAARRNMDSAAWDMILARQESLLAAQTPVPEEEG